jgi:hypothetical protein
MARGIGSLVKSAVGSVAQVPGAEEIVLQAVRDIFNELKQLRRENDRLRKQVDGLNRQLDAARGRKWAAKRGGAKRTPAKRAPAKRSAPRARTTTRRGGILGDLLG